MTKNKNNYTYSVEHQDNALSIIKESNKIPSYDALEKFESRTMFSGMALSVFLTIALAFNDQAMDYMYNDLGVIEGLEEFSIAGYVAIPMMLCVGIAFGLFNVVRYIKRKTIVRETLYAENFGRSTWSQNDVNMINTMTKHPEIMEDLLQMNTHTSINTADQSSKVLDMMKYAVYAEENIDNERRYKAIKDLHTSYSFQLEALKQLQ